MELGFNCNVSNLLVVIATLVVLLYLYANKSFRYWKRQGIRSPVGGIWDFLLTSHEFLKKPLHLVQMEQYKKYGRIYGRYLGSRPQLSIAEPDILKRILVKDFNMFHNRMKLDTGKPLLDNMLTALVDDDWKRIRCIVSPTFSSSRMRKMAYLIKECAEKFSENLKKIADENQNRAVDCKKYFSCFAIDVIATTAFGTKLSSLDDPNNEFVNKAQNATNRDIPFTAVLFFFCPKLAKLFKVDLSHGLFEYLKKFTLHVIERREKEKTKTNDFLQLLLEAQKGILEISPEDDKEDNEAQLDFKILPKHKTMSLDEMMAQCTLFLFAGNETNANTLLFVMYYLALNPEIQEKLIKEIDEIWESNNDINFDVLNKMPYLDAVIKETLRKEPIAIELMRECTEEYKLSEVDFKIPKGMNVIVPVYAMHHDENFFPNPEKFDPQRFMPENRNSIPPYAYLPFGEGPRNCIGMRFANMILKMCIVHIFRDIRIHATEETKKPLEFYKGQGFILPKKVMVKLERRK